MIRVKCWNNKSKFQENTLYAVQSITELTSNSTRLYINRTSSKMIPITHNYSYAVVNGKLTMINAEQNR